MSIYSKFGVTKSFWDSLSEKERDLFIKVNPFLTEDENHYSVRSDNLLSEFENLQKEAVSYGGNFQLEPEYQRDSNQWNESQKIAYVENLVRNIAPVEFKFNRDKNGDITCIDGLQRISAILSFINGEFFVFGDLSLADLHKTRFSLSRRKLIFKLYTFEEKIDLYNFYLKLNEGGTTHSGEDIEKVKELIRKEENDA